VSDEHDDPSGNTEAFQAFVRQVASGDPELAGTRSRLGIVIAATTAAIIVIALIVFVLYR
jgi:hypothetical protein